jgi:hypothetical protein
MRDQVEIKKGSRWIKTDQVGSRGVKMGQGGSSGFKKAL